MESKYLLKLTRGLWKRTKLSAVRKGVTLNEWVTDAIKEKLKRGGDVEAEQDKEVEQDNDITIVEMGKWRNDAKASKKP